MTESIPTLLVYAFLTLYAVNASLLFIYGVHAYVISAVFARTNQRRKTIAETDPAPAPFVTVQLPVYNELYVVDRLLAAACSFDYPRDRFEVQVLDDSTDETTERVARLCARYQEWGIQIHQVRRGTRTGFKGGALRAGLEQARGDYVAIFDADFVPPRGFLDRAVREFEDPSVGLVQARWGHLNEDYSPLTRAQAMALDGHFVIEQTARNRAGAFINFNGTAGMWRKDCIIDAGNWQDDTLTEDLDLSYRAQLRGWKFVYLEEVICPAELPVEVNAFKAQQFRWAKGSMQTARKVLPGLLRRPLSLFAKMQAVIHLTNHLVYPLLLLLALLILPSLMILEHVPATSAVFRALTVLVIASFGHPFLYVLSQRATRPDWSRRLWIVPMIVAGGMGIAVNNTRAVLQAWRGLQSPFERTPKYRLVSRSDEWQKKKYRAAHTASTYIEILMGGYILLTALYATATGRYLILPFLALYLTGFLYIGIFSIVHSRVRRGRPSQALDLLPQQTSSPSQARAGGTYSTARAIQPTR